MPTRRLQVVRSGERTNPAGKPVSNKILLSIPDAEYRLIRPHLEFLDLPNRLRLHEPPEKLQFAYFPNSGFVSLVASTKGGRDAEARPAAPVPGGGPTAADQSDNVQPGVDKHPEVQAP